MCSVIIGQSSTSQVAVYWTSSSETCMSVLKWSCQYFVGVHVYLAVCRYLAIYTRHSHIMILIIHVSFLNMC